MHVHLLSGLRWIVAFSALIAFVFGFVGWWGLSAIGPLAVPRAALPGTGGSSP